MKNKKLILIIFTVILLFASCKQETPNYDFIEANNAINYPNVLYHGDKKFYSNKNGTFYSYNGEEIKIDDNIGHSFKFSDGYLYYCCQYKQQNPYISYSIYRASEENFQPEKIYEGSNPVFCINKDNIITYEYIDTESYGGYRILEISKEGTNKRVILENEEEQIYSFTAFENNIYFTSGKDMYSTSGIYKLSVDTGKTTHLIEGDVKDFVFYSMGIIYTVDNEDEVACYSINFNGKNKKEFDLSELNELANIIQPLVIDDTLFLVWRTAEDSNELRLSSIDINTGETTNIRDDIFIESHLFTFDKKIVEYDLIERTFRELDY